ncbi:MAG: asparaginase domain-containing protein [Vallitaleaceae bacterium]|jgi:L-asparaginase|nr:asparaginase domain-containing protein [Vallitaleaceae bacterium]
MRILAVFTGGTIGSVVSGDTIDVDISARDMLLSYVNKHIEETIEFDITQPFNILSENIIPNHWHILHKHLLTHDLTQYDGVIVAHGSDTLPYTASIMSYLFSHISIPMVFTGSNYPLEDGRSNGRRNFLSCVAFVRENIPGVFTIFENEKQEPIVYLATRMLEAMHVTDLFESFGDIIFGKIIKQQFIYHISEVNPSIEDLRVPKPERFRDLNYLGAPIMVIKPYPGLNYQYYQFGSNKPLAIIHDLYHSATHNTTDLTPNESLKAYIDYCTSVDVKLYLVPFRNSEEKMYISSKKLLDAGAIPLRNISMISAITKLILAYSYFDNDRDINAFINQRIFYEYLDISK